MENTWLRRRTLRGRTGSENEPPLGAFVIERLGLDLHPGVDKVAGEQADAASPQWQLRAAQARAVDNVLAADGAPSGVEMKLISDYLESFGSEYSRRTNGANAHDARHVVGIVQDNRIRLSTETRHAVRFAAQESESSAPLLAATLWNQLDRLGPPPPPLTNGSARDIWTKQIGMLTESLAQLPAEAVRPFRPQAAALVRDPERRLRAIPFLRRLDLYGPEIVPDIFQMMDAMAMLRVNDARARLDMQSVWSDVWRAGAVSICRLAPRTPGALEELRVRASVLVTRKLGIPQQTIAAAMLRIGATDDDIRATLAFDAQDEKQMRNFGYLLRDARRDNRCEH